GPGFFYAPTVLAAVEQGMPAFDEEVFGPVAAVTRGKDESQAVRVANASRGGLGASVWTADSAQGERLACDLEAGSVFVNGLVKSDPRLPFGGVKRSGYGRELSEYGLKELVNIKTVWVAGGFASGRRATTSPSGRGRYTPRSYPRRRCSRITPRDSRRSRSTTPPTSY